jgi:large subunit ribosomal protein L13
LGEKTQTTTGQIAVINAEGLVLGRMATKIAKRLLEGEEIVIVNAEKAIFSGKKKAKVTDAKKFLGVGRPMEGPKHYRRPDRIVRKTVRGMLPFKQPKGKSAFKRLKVYIGLPDEFKDRQMETVKEAHATKLQCPYFTVGEFAKEIGWNQGE